MWVLSVVRLPALLLLRTINPRYRRTTLGVWLAVIQELAVPRGV